ncbi:hypothetical protein SBA3_690043 [Candidatus Sulfopaludibacter sp. SbA3]|nr:hypothetical protein SBA3_690043 [Candidatus Sulfopaludibacter sp. SbA3]
MRVQFPPRAPCFQLLTTPVIDPAVPQGGLLALASLLTFVEEHALSRPRTPKASNAKARSRNVPRHRVGDVSVWLELENQEAFDKPAP